MRILTALALLLLTCSIPAFAEDAPAETVQSPEPEAGAENGPEGVSREFFLEKLVPVVSEKVLLSAGYLARNDHPFGYITGFDGRMTIALSGDNVYFNHGSDANVKAGDRFFVYKKGRTVTFPGADEEFGYLVTIAGLIEVTEVGDVSSTALVRAEYDEIEKGDGLTPEFAVIPPKIDPDKPLDNKLISGEIVCERFGKGAISIGDVVYLNVGRSDGVVEADVFGVLEPQRKKRWWEWGGDEKLPEHQIGKLVVILVRDGTSTAVVSSAKDEIKVGYKFNYIQHR